ncbi:MAG: hypothetical protein HY666_06055 [Chloroflexi bacterium]|nr:hypothetical protein [Chloroflexota bacterium]
MADLILDTTLFIDYYRGDSAARHLVEGILSGATKASYCPFILAELWQDSSLGRREEVVYTALVSFLEEATISSESAKVAGTWLRPFSKEEQIAYYSYALLAAVAQERRETICTRDTEPYLRFYPKVRSY